MSHFWHESHSWMRHHPYGWVMSYPWMGHDSHTDGPCPKEISHATCMHELCHAKWSMSHMNEACHIWTSHATHKWVIPPMNEACHVQTSHATHKRVYQKHEIVWEKRISKLISFASAKSPFLSGNNYFTLFQIISHYCLFSLKNDFSKSPVSQIKCLCYFSLSGLSSTTDL